MQESTGLKVALFGEITFLNIKNSKILLKISGSNISPQIGRAKQVGNSLEFVCDTFYG